MTLLLVTSSLGLALECSVGTGLSQVRPVPTHHSKTSDYSGLVIKMTALVQEISPSEQAQGKPLACVMSANILLVKEVMWSSPITAVGNGTPSIVGGRS